jgi:hypothetical protein
MNVLAKDSNCKGNPILSSERMLHKDYDRRCSVEKKSDRESQGAWRQDKLIGGKPPVVNKLSNSVIRESVKRRFSRCN